LEEVRSMDPLLEVKSKTLGTGIQGSLRAYPEEVEVRTVHSPREVEVQTARYDEISEVEIDRGMTFADLEVSTRGFLRGKTLLVRGLSVEDAERAKAFIEERMAHDT
jgi:hypothetical protein